LTLLAGHLHHTPETGTWSAEASAVGWPPGLPPPVLVVVLPDDATTRPEALLPSAIKLFRLVGADRYHLGEGICGWTYRGPAGSFLLVND
jgi:hypothetical protein